MNQAPLSEFDSLSHLFCESDSTDMFLTKKNPVQRVICELDYTICFSITKKNLLKNEFVLVLSVALYLLCIYKYTHMHVYI